MPKCGLQHFTVRPSAMRGTRGFDARPPALDSARTGEYAFGEARQAARFDIHLEGPAMKSGPGLAILPTMAAMLCLASASSALAKPVCISSSGGIDMKFAKVKLKPGSASPLTGVTDSGSTVSGAVFTNTAGTATNVRVVVGGPGTVNNNLAYAWSGDLTLAGTGDIDTNGNNSSADAFEGARTFTVLDCALFVVP